MILLLISWLLLFFIFLAYGDVMTKVIACTTKDFDNFGIIEQVFLGICTLGVILLWLSIFFPLNFTVFGVIILFPVFYWIANRGKLQNVFGKAKSFFVSLSVPDCILLFAVFVGVSIFSLSSPMCYDMDLYHLQSMQWTSEYKTVLGLGNLHGRLAFNSSFLLLSTLFFYNIKEIVYLFPLNSFAILVLTTWIFSRFKSSSIKKYCSIIILLALIYMMGMTFSSTSTDVLVNVFVLFIFLFILSEKQFGFGSNYIFVLILSLFCITLKLSCGLILFVPIVLLVYSLYLKGNNKVFYFSLSVGIGLVVLLPWLVRYVMLSGYLIYPFEGIDLFTVDWKIPAEFVVGEKEAAYAWARIPNEATSKVLSMSFSEWFPKWFSGQYRSQQALFCLAFLSPISILFFHIRKKLNVQLFHVWLIGFLGTLFLMFTAPDLRFGIGFVLTAGFIPYVCISSKFFNTLFLDRMIFVCLLCFASLIVKNSIGQIELFQLYTDNSVARLALYPQEYNLRDGYIKYYEVETNSGKISYPTLGNKCYDAPLPCGCEYNPNLRFRGTGSAEGFIIKQNNIKE